MKLKKLFKAVIATATAIAGFLAVINIGPNVEAAADYSKRIVTNYGESDYSIYHGKVIEINDYYNDYVNKSLKHDNKDFYNVPYEIFENEEFDNYVIRLSSSPCIVLYDDDPITSFVDRSCLVKPGDYVLFGNEYGYYVHTEELNYDDYFSVILLFDIERSYNLGNRTFEYTVKIVSQTATVALNEERLKAFTQNNFDNNSKSLRVPDSSENGTLYQNYASGENCKFRNHYVIAPVFADAWWSYNTNVNHKIASYSTLALSSCKYGANYSSDAQNLSFGCKATGLIQENIFIPNEVEQEEIQQLCVDILKEYGSYLLDETKIIIDDYIKSIIIDYFNLGTYETLFNIACDEIQEYIKIFSMIVNFITNQISETGDFIIEKEEKLVNIPSSFSGKNNYFFEIEELYEKANENLNDDQKNFFVREANKRKLFILRDHVPGNQEYVTFREQFDTSVEQRRFMNIECKTFFSATPLYKNKTKKGYVIPNDYQFVKNNKNEEGFSLQKYKISDMNDSSAIISLGAKGTYNDLVVDFDKPQYFTIEPTTTASFRIAGCTYQYLYVTMKIWDEETGKLVGLIFNSPAIDIRIDLESNKKYRVELTCFFRTGGPNRKTLEKLPIKLGFSTC